MLPIDFPEHTAISKNVFIIVLRSQQSGKRKANLKANEICVLFPKINLLFLPCVDWRTFY